MQEFDWSLEDKAHDCLKYKLQQLFAISWSLSYKVKVCIQIIQERISKFKQDSRVIWFLQQSSSLINSFKFVLITFLRQVTRHVTNMKSQVTIVVYKTKQKKELNVSSSFFCCFLFKKLVRTLWLACPFYLSTSLWSPNSRVHETRQREKLVNN